MGRFLGLSESDSAMQSGVTIALSSGGWGISRVPRPVLFSSFLLLAKSGARGSPCGLRLEMGGGLAAGEGRTCWSTQEPLWQS